MNSREEISTALEHLRRKDPVLAKVMDQVGPFQIRHESNLFKAIVRAILAQQISTGAARSIFLRLLGAAGNEDRLREALLRMTPEELRLVGVSPQKTKYLKDLAQRVSAGTVRLDEFHLMSNDAIIAQLTEVKGIGKWTAQMLLIFSLGRLDVFPADDFGVRSAIRKLYRKRSMPSPKQLRRFERLWQPYASVASWYCWRSLELE